MQSKHAAYRSGEGAEGENGNFECEGPPEAKFNFVHFILTKKEMDASRL